MLDRFFYCPICSTCGQKVIQAPLCKEAKMNGFCSSDLRIQCRTEKEKFEERFHSLPNWVRYEKGLL